MNLIIDIGNTTTKVAIFDGEELIKHQILKQPSLSAIILFSKEHNISNSIISSVKQKDSICNELITHFNALFLTHKTEIPISTNYNTPETLGKDRLAGIVGANKEYPNKNILVICDDLNLYFGKIKLKSNGSSGGHNGLKDIEEHLKNNNYSRLRVGVLNSKKFNKTDYVLGEWTNKEQDELKNIVNNSVKIALSFIHNGIDQTMNIHNTKNLMDENI